MTNGFWGEDQVSELDLVEEAQEAEELASQYAYEPTIVQAEEEELLAINEESAYDLEEEESNIIYNARIRLEQAKLYEMLINHPIFDGVSADPHAIDIVSNELKHYIVKRLEILMGLRQPAVVSQNEVASEFNTVELDFLKALSYKGTNGKSANAEPARPRQVTGGLKSLGAQRPPSQPKKLVETAQAPPPPRRRAQPSKPLPAQGRGGVKKKTSTGNKRSVKVESSMSERPLRQDEIEALAREDIEKSKGRKNFHKMTAKEKRAEIDRVNARHSHKPAPSTNRVPMASADQMQSVYNTQQTRRSDLVSGNQGGGGGFGSIMANIANQIAVKKSSQGE